MFEEEILDRTLLIQLHSKELSKIQIHNNDDDVVSDYDKLAYWRASKEDTTIASERLQKTMEWRTSMNMNNLLNDPIWLNKEKAMRKILWYDYLGCDQYGRPILIERVGRWDITQVLREASNTNNSNMKGGKEEETR